MNAAQKIAWLDARNEQYRTLCHYQRVARRLFQQPVTMPQVKDVYRLGILPAVFPMPAIQTRVSWKLSVDSRPVVIVRDGNIEYATTDWI